MADRENEGVFLCRCNGRVSAGIPLNDLREYLEAAQPGLRVVIGDNLCQAPVLRDLMREQEMRPSVIGGCAQLKSRPGFWEEPESCLLDPDTVGLVDLLGEAESPYSPDDRWTRVKALLLAKVKRQEKFDGIPPRARRIHFATPQGEVTRRDLLQSILPRYRLAPYVDTARCVGERCRVCRQACPSEAISVDAGRLSIDVLRCQGCGACSAVCPSRAVSYPNYSLEQLEAELAGLLSDCVADFRPIVAFVCQNADLDSIDQKLWPPNLFVVEVPCLALIPAWLMLRAYELGAQGLILVVDKEKCRLKIEESMWRGTADFVQAVLGEIGVGRKRFMVAEGDSGIARLPEMIHEMSGLPCMSRALPEKPATPAEALTPAAVIVGLVAQIGGSLDGTVSSGKVPFGKLRLDRRRCTACGICVPECPAEALTAVSDADSLKIIFKQADCIGCGQCAEICPEKCLEVERVLELSKLVGEPEVLLEGDFVRCVWCGTPFAPRSMYEKLRDRIAAAGGNVSQLEKCPECRMKGRSPGTKMSRSGV